MARSLSARAACTSRKAPSTSCGGSARCSWTWAMRTPEWYSSRIFCISSLVSCSILVRPSVWAYWKFDLPMTSRMAASAPLPTLSSPLRRSWPLRMTSSMSGGRRDPNGPPPPRLPPPPPPPPHGPPLLLFPPPPQGPPLLLFHAIHHLERRAGLCFHAGLHICDDSHTSN